MPKDEFDPEDPLELRGVGLLTPTDTSEPMTECLVEEFMRLGHAADEILALFRNPHYTGMNLVYQNRGEAFVKAKITEVFGWWNRPVTWSGQPEAAKTAASPVGREIAAANPPQQPMPSPGPDLTDPFGAPIPHLDR